jgi:uncharacterized protein (TIGR03084 family)
MSVDLAGLLEDLRAETTTLDTLLDLLDASEWDRPTPAAGWSVRDQVGHLAYFDEAMVTAVRAPARFRAEADALVAHGADHVAHATEGYVGLAPSQVHEWFREARADLLEAFTGVGGERRIPWYGPPMSAATALTARLMETWAHGHDVAAATGQVPVPTDRLRHVAHLGVATFGFSFAVHGLAVPDRRPRVELTAPSGGPWVWESPGSEELIRGTAEAFCLVVTQRRHVAETDLFVVGPVASRWLEIAQAFAGPPTTRRSAAGRP